jgi:glycosyltransferase involved in cell wall biosynthesis
MTTGIQVVYDISVLGIGHRRPKARTGVFRVAESLGLGLSASPEGELMLCAAHSRSAYRESLKYLAESRNFSGVRMLPPARTQRHVRMLEECARLCEQTRLLGPLRPYLQWGAWKVVNLIGAPGRAPDLTSMRKMTVYHSPFTPLPPQTLPGIPRFLTVYDMIPRLYPNLFPAKVRTLFDRILGSLRPDDWVLAISQSTKSDFCRLTGFDPSRVFVTQLAASPEMFHRSVDGSALRRVRQKYNLPEAPYVLSLNTLEPRKNVHTAIRGFARMVRQQRNADLQFVLVGTKGWNDQLISRSIEEAPELRDRIRVLGYVDDGDLAEIYSGALMFVYVPIYEGFGLPPLEAMQCGVPVITSNTSSLPELVGDAGIMVSPTDTDALAQKMWEVYSSESLRAELSIRSLERAKLFSWGRCANETLAAYRTSLGIG